MKAAVRRERALLAALTAAFLLAGPVLDAQGRPELRDSLLLGFTVAVGVVGFDLIFGLTKQLHLGQSFFVAGGAYGSAVLSIETGISPALSIPLAVCATSALANVLGRVLFRIREFYFAAATFGLGLVGLNLIINLREYTGGEDGLAVPIAKFGSWELNEPSTMYSIAVVIGVIVVTLGRNYRRSPRGAAARAVGLDESAAAAQGIDCTAVKVEVFTLGAAIAAFGGALYATFTGYLFSSQFAMINNIEVFVVTVLGGAGSIIGPFVAAVGLHLLPDLMAVFDEYPDLAFGAILVISLLLTDRLHQRRELSKPDVHAQRAASELDYRSPETTSV